MSEKLAPAKAIPSTASGKQKWRRTKEYRDWVDAVKDNHNNTCQSCHRHDDELPEGEHIHAHHIRHATFYPELKYVVENGAALCEQCHGKLHNKFAGGTRNKCTRVHYDRLLDVRDHFWEVQNVAI